MRYSRVWALVWQWYGERNLVIGIGVHYIEHNDDDDDDSKTFIKVKWSVDKRKSLE